MTRFSSSIASSPRALAFSVALIVLLTVLGTRALTSQPASNTAPAALTQAVAPPAACSCSAPAQLPSGNFRVYNCTCGTQTCAVSFTGSNATVAGGTAVACK